MDKLEAQKQRSRAEVLYCLDVLIRHLADHEDAMNKWLEYGIPDGTLVNWPTDKQLEPFLYYAEDERSFEDFVWAAMKLLRYKVMDLPKSETYYVRGSFV